MSYRVWYIPQIPGSPFYARTATLEEAQHTLETLSSFSLFEYNNRIKPDYADAGGIEVWDPESGEWDSLDDELV